MSDQYKEKLQQLLKRLTRLSAADQKQIDEVNALFDREDWQIQPSDKKISDEQIKKEIEGFINILENMSSVKKYNQEKIDKFIEENHLKKSEATQKQSPRKKN